MTDNKFFEGMPYSRGARVRLVVNGPTRQIIAGGSRPLTETCTLEINSWSPSMGSPAVFGKDDNGEFVAFDYADVESGKISATELP